MLTKMAMNTEGQVVFKDYPAWCWPVGLVTVGLAAWVPETSWQRLLFMLIGVALVAFASVLIVSVDHRMGMLNLRYQSLMRSSTKTYPLSEICFVNVAEDSEGERMYRVELILWSGQVVPLRCGYSIGKARKEHRAEQLRSVIQVGSNGPAAGINLRLQNSKH